MLIRGEIRYEPDAFLHMYISLAEKLENNGAHACGYKWLGNRFRKVSPKRLTGDLC